MPTDKSWLDALSDSPLNLGNYPGYAAGATQFAGNALSNIARSMSPVRFQEGEDAGFYPQVPPMITETAGAWNRLFGEQNNWHDGPGEVYPGDMNADAATMATAFYGGNALGGLRRGAVPRAEGKSAAKEFPYTIERGDPDGMFGPSYEVRDGSSPIASFNYEELPNAVMVNDARVEPGYQRQGIASNTYGKIQDDFGKPMTPDLVLSEDGYNFWKSHYPRAVRDHEFTGNTWVDKRLSKGGIGRAATEEIMAKNGVPDWRMSGGPNRPDDVLWSDNKPSILGSALATADQPQGIIAYHGSPHDFDKFSLDKIGTGEGAQAYGHGLYFAENEGVAKSYRDALTGNHALDQFDYTIDGQKVTPTTTLKNIIRDYGRDPNKFIERMQPKLKQLQDKVARASQDDDLGLGFSDRDLAIDNLAEHQKLIDEAQGYIGRDLGLNPLGRMYQVRINADPNDFLDWDLPLSQQPEAAQKAIQSHPAFLPPLSENPDNFMRNAMRDPETSNMLREAGIPGIRYKDAMSRGTDGGSSNYVVFDDAMIEIMKKYGMAGAVLGAGQLGLGLTGSEANASEYDPELEDILRRFGGY